MVKEAVRLQSIEISPPNVGLIHTLELTHPYFRDVPIVVVGSRSATPEQNQAALGDYEARHLASIYKAARERGLRVAFDMPTGSSPKPAWGALRSVAEQEKIDLSSIVWFGHEADWPPQPGSHLGYEDQRLQILKTVGVEPQYIVDPKIAEQSPNPGNYVSMHLVEPTDLSIKAVETAAKQSAREYDKTLAALFNRHDALSVGHYGVGPDGHGGGEYQLFQLWLKEWLETRNSFIIPVGAYSYEKGLWRLMGRNDAFDIGNNALAYKDNPYVQFLMGLGRNVIENLDFSLHIFNNASKFTPFAHTLNALGGRLHTADGRVMRMSTDIGEGEALFKEFQSYAAGLEQKGMLTSSKYNDAKDCYDIVQIIGKTLKEGTHPEEIYYPLWRLINRYFGAQIPVSRIIRERAMKGKRTSILISADALIGTEYESLALK